MLRHERAPGFGLAPFLRLETALLWFPFLSTELTPSERAAATAAAPEHVRKAMGPDEAKRPDVRWRIEGIASTEHEDQQGDTILQGGVDWSALLKRGFLNDDHGEGVDAILGYPVAVEPTVVRDGNKTVKATRVVGYLFDLPKAMERVQLAKAMHGTPRQMGFSVEGPKPERDPRNPKIIRRASVHHLAITPWPVNPHATVADVSLAKANRLLKSMTLTDRLRAASERMGLRKAMTAGDGLPDTGAAVGGDAAPVVVESAGGLTVADLFNGAQRRKGRRSRSKRHDETMDELARRLGVDRRTVGRALAALKGAG